jgi:hypothetical protein
VQLHISVSSYWTVRLTKAHCSFNRQKEGRKTDRQTGKDKKKDRRRRRRREGGRERERERERVSLVMNTWREGEGEWVGGSKFFKHLSVTIHKKTPRKVLFSSYRR